MRCLTGRMEYTYIAPPENANDGWMGHHVKLFVDNEKRDDFWAFLENYCGPKGKDWRRSKRQERWIWGDEPIELRFRHKKHAMVVKLQWVEDEDPMKRTMEEMRKLAGGLKVYLPSQAIGRGLRNARVTATKPSNPLSRYNSQIYPDIVDYSGLVSRKHIAETLGLSGKHWGSILLDDPLEAAAGPVKSVVKCRDRGDEVMTTAMLEARLAGSTSLPVLYEVRSDERRESGADRTSG